jgi:hypothetical protein
MIGELPKSLEIDDKEWAIRCNMRTALIIFEAFNDLELNDKEKMFIMLKCLYKKMPPNVEEAINKAIWFLNGGKEIKGKSSSIKLLDWNQDESLIFSAINKIAGKEVRSENIHWWTFLGYFNEIGEGLFSTVINIRQKKSKGKKLEKYEQDFYRENKEIIDLKMKYTAEEKAEIDRLNELLK